MKKQVNIILTGLNGYGKNFVKEMLNDNNDNYKLVAVVSGNPEKNEYYTTLIKHGVKIYDTIENCLGENKVDLAIITTPVHIHYNEVICALNHGANVFCEKPLAPTIDECLEIQKLSKKTNLFVAVDFQWSYSKAIQNLKKDILSNKFGEIKKCKTIVQWNRPKSYFKNSNWKGKNVDIDGKFILDCIISNNASHFLHNILFLSGKNLYESAYPISIEGEGYKANKVDGYDTIFMRINTDANCDLLLLATIATNNVKHPIFEIEFEEATVCYNPNEAINIIVKTRSGKIIEYGSPEEGRFTHWLSAVNSIISGEKVACNLNTTLPGIIAINASIENIPVVQFEPSMIEEDENGVWVKDIDNVLEDCFESEKLPNEIGYKWAYKSRKVDVRGYSSFSGVAKYNQCD